MELKALSASTRRTASLSSCWQTTYIPSMTASDAASWSAHTWSNPAASFTSFFAIYRTTFPAIRYRASPTPIGRTPGLLFGGINRLVVKVLNYCQYLNLKDVCLCCISVLRNLLWMFEGLRDWTQTGWKPRFCASYQHQIQMSHILFSFLLLLSLLNLHQCLHKQCCVFAFLGLVMSLRDELVVLLDVSNSEFAKFCR